MRPTASARVPHPPPPNPLPWPHAGPRARGPPPVQVGPHLLFGRSERQPSPLPLIPQRGVGRTRPPANRPPIACSSAQRGTVSGTWGSFCCLRPASPRPNPGRTRLPQHHPGGPPTGPSRVGRRISPREKRKIATVTAADRARAGAGRSRFKAVSPQISQADTAEARVFTPARPGSRTVTRPVTSSKPHRRVVAAPSESPIWAPPGSLYRERGTEGREGIPVPNDLGLFFALGTSSAVPRVRTPAQDGRYPFRLPHRERANQKKGAAIARLTKHKKKAHSSSNCPTRTGGGPPRFLKQYGGGTP